MDPIEANKIVYAKAAASYDETEPHFFTENKSKVKKILQQIRLQSGPKLLDVGCGTGFIINLAKDLFDEIHGVDISPEMLGRVDCSTGNIKLYKSEAENLIFEAEYFDVVTAYAFLHHLENYEKVIKQVFRVLKKNGIFYIDLEPNKKYCDLVSNYKNYHNSQNSEVVKNEIRTICYADKKVEETYGIDGNIFNMSEYTRSVFGGINADDFLKIVKKIGFSDCKVFYEWYPGQGKIIHQQSEKDAEIIDHYLREIFPFSECLFKYLRFIITK